MEIDHQEWDSALKEREAALALAPNDPAMIAVISAVAIQAGKPDDAIACKARNDEGSRLKRDLSQLPLLLPLLQIGLGLFRQGRLSTGAALSGAGAPYRSPRRSLPGKAY